MTLKPACAAATAVFVTLLSLAGCGGGSGSSSSSSSTSSSGSGSGASPTATAVNNPAQFSATDVVLGTGTEATTGKTVTVTYTGWLYTDAAADHKGTQFDSGTFSFVLGQGQVIAGFDQGVTGMKVGGKRTLLIPSSLGYGSSANGAIPANAGLVFDVALTAVQ